MLVGSSILLSIKLWRHPTIKWSLALGVVLGLATLTKTYAVIYYPTPILLWLLLGKEINWRKLVKLLTIVYATTLFAWLPIFTVGQQAYWQDHYWKLVIASPETDLLDTIWFNVLLVDSWLSAYLTWPVLSLLLFTLLIINIKHDKPGLILIILVIGPLCIFTVFFTVWYPRYLLHLIVPISVIFARGVDYLADLMLHLTKWIVRKGIISRTSLLVLQRAVLLILFSPSILFDYLIITAPTTAPFPPTDKLLYFEGRGTGYGLRESAQFIRKLTEQYPEVTLLRDSNASKYATASFYLSNTERLSIKNVPSYYATTPQELDSYAKRGPTLSMIVSGKSHIVDNSDLFDGSKYPQVWQLASFPKPGARWSVEVYQWLLPPDFAVRWFQQGGDAEPRIAWQASDTLVTATGGQLIDWSQLASPTMEDLPQSLEAANVEYVLATPELISNHPDLFAPFITTEGTHLRVNQLPPGWRLAVVYPEINCQWCLFQLRPPNHPTQVVFGKGTELEGYDISITKNSSDRLLHVTLYGMCQ